MSHTKGEWRVKLISPVKEQPNHPASFVEIISTDDSPICTLTSAHLADAHLIVAAPEMLEVLQNLHKEYSDFSQNHFDLVEIRKMISDVLAKAKGES